MKNYKNPQIENAKSLVDQLDNDFSDLKQSLTKSQLDLANTLRETRMYMVKDIRKACEDAGLNREQWLAVEAELQAQFDSFFGEDKNEEWALRERDDFDRAVSTHESNYMDRMAN